MDLKHWLQGIPDTFAFYGWVSALAVIALVSLACLVTYIVQLYRHRAEVSRLEGVVEDLRKAFERTSPGESKQNSRPRLRAALGRPRLVLSRWTLVLGDLASTGRQAGEQLEALLEAPFEGLERLLEFFRSAATLTGLFFTFLGLAITLSELSGNLLVKEGQNIDAVLKGVRSALPGLGTAFASSIVGVLVAVVVGLLHSILSALRNGLHQRQLRFVAEKLEPIFTPKAGEQGIIQALYDQRGALSAGLEKLFKFSKESLERQESVATTVAGAVGSASKIAKSSEVGLQRLAGLTEQLNAVPDSLTGVWNEVLTSLGETQKGWVEQAQQQQQAIDGRLGETLSLLLGRLDQDQKAWRDSLAEQRNLFRAAWKGALDDIRGHHKQVVADLDDVAKMQTSERVRSEAAAQGLISAMQEAAGSLSTTSNQLELSFDGVLARFTKLSDAHEQRVDTTVSELLAKADTAAGRLELSSAHIEALSGASTRFEQAIGSVQTVAENAIAREAELARQLKGLFSEVPTMAQAVVGAASRMTDATESFNRVIQQDALQLYLRQLPELGEQLEKQRDTYEGMSQAALAVKEASTKLDTVAIASRQMAGYALEFSRQHQQVLNAFGEFTNGRLLPAVRTSMEAAAKTTMDTYGGEWREHLGRLASTSHSFQHDVVRLTENTNNLLRLLSKPFWSRWLRGGDHAR